jgi:hypothetical protein
MNILTDRDIYGNLAVQESQVLRRQLLSTRQVPRTAGCQAVESTTPPYFAHPVGFAR